VAPGTVDGIRVSFYRGSSRPREWGWEDATGKAVLARVAVGSRPASTSSSARRERPRRPFDGHPRPAVYSRRYFLGGPYRRLLGKKGLHHRRKRTTSKHSTGSRDIVSLSTAAKVLIHPSMPTRWGAACVDPLYAARPLVKTTNPGRSNRFFANRGHETLSGSCARKGLNTLGRQTPTPGRPSRYPGGTSRPVRPQFQRFGQGVGPGPTATRQGSGGNAHCERRNFAKPSSPILVLVEHLAVGCGKVGRARTPRPLFREEGKPPPGPLQKMVKRGGALRDVGAGQRSAARWSGGRSANNAGEEAYSP